MKHQGTPFNEISFYVIQKYIPLPTHMNLFEYAIAKIVNRVIIVLMSYFHSTFSLFFT